ncbi:plasmid pRiA4b ORF-3 family protein [Mycobacterium sp. pV006]|uniref:plasmid pRiA4b ORF-3 family protein n=1 Tax=Mycobacterium sp. pV006 TaxID=3238983 RepID=UPI00351AB2DE
MTDLEPRPDLRHPQRTEPVVYRIRVDLDDAQPAIWRLIDLRSDLTLDVVHQALQAAFDWTDSHLHCFSLGGSPFDAGSQSFLCSFDLEEEEGVAAEVTRLDETLTEPGDVLHYVYDYGDNWKLTLRLEEVLPADGGGRSAVVVDGERAAPPEDCGHRVDAESLAEVLPNPALFELERINTALRGPYFVLWEAGIDARLIDLVYRLTYSPLGDELSQTALSLASESEPPDTATMASNLRAFQWYLDRAADGGIALTSAGYLKPADVEEAAKVVPTMRDWLSYGKNNREASSLPLLEFRQQLQSLGLLRKSKGTLLLTKAGQAARRDITVLWRHLASRLVPQSGDDFNVQAILLTLAYAAANPNANLPWDKVTGLLYELGWRHPDGRSVAAAELRHLPLFTILVNVTDQPVTWRRRDVVSPVAAALARAALRG